MELDRYLENIENRLDTSVEEELESQWRTFLAGKFEGHVFIPRRIKKSPTDLPWPKIPINKALDDFEAMMIREMGSVSGVLGNGGGSILNIRANYGTGILPSVFGCDMFIMPDHTDTLPTAIKLPGGSDDMRKLVEAGAPDVKGKGWWNRVFECGQFYKEHLAPYPKLKNYVQVYHPDIQGPLDVCELVWGSDMLYAFIEEPELLQQVLEVLTETYVRFLKRWNAENPLPAGRQVSHWGLGINGTIMLRNDSAMNISGDMYRDYVMRFDQRLLTEFGGGAVHFCGRGDQYVEHLSHLSGITGVQMSQPEFNNMETIFQNTVDKGIPLLNLVKRGIPDNRDLHGLVMSW